VFPLLQVITWQFFTLSSVFPYLLFCLQTIFLTIASFTWPLNIILDLVIGHLLYIPKTVLVSHYSLAYLTKLLISATFPLKILQAFVLLSHSSLLSLLFIPFIYAPTSSQQPAVYCFGSMFHLQAYETALYKIILNFSCVLQLQSKLYLKLIITIRA
jgi:hypothetical protein